MKAMMILAAGLLAVGSVAWWMLAGARAPAPAPATVAPQAEVVGVPPLVSAPVSAPAPAPAATGLAAVATYPDGSTMPLLNGVREPIVVQWSANQPFTPVVETISDERGMLWYRHENGMLSTTCYVFDQVRGESVPISEVARPVPKQAQPVLQHPGGN